MGPGSRAAPSSTCPSPTLQRSERPFAFVFQLARDRDGELVWIFIAFGRRHPGPGVRSVYERAHRQLHGGFPGAR